MTLPNGYAIPDGSELSLEMTRAIIRRLMNPNAGCMVHEFK